MAIRLGSGSNFAANKIKLGSTSITKVYLGATQIWPVSVGVGDYYYYWINGIIYRKSKTFNYRYSWINGIIYRVEAAGTPPVYTPSLIFSDSRNSQYLGAGGAS